MRPVRVSVRTIVYATEDEDRVTQAFLHVLGREGDADARSRITRSRLKSHHGAPMLFLDSVLTRPKELRLFFTGLRGVPDLGAALRAEFRARLDEHNVLHFRLDKQDAVEGRIALGSGGDAFSVEIKYERRGEEFQGYPFDEPV